MPIYEYKCSQCDSHFEKIQKASDEPLKQCEQCGGELQKQWSLSGFQFKGEGWYVTDYAKKKNSESDTTKDKGEKTAKSESTEKTESASKEKSSEKVSKDTKESVKK
ncbi:MAG: zinc ribbon domain-containing protein [Pyrinomonadaceae bacterium]|nr:zinc ribbon domain-containing protein [Pyrinomonadaceae bacterium]